MSLATTSLEPSKQWLAPVSTGAGGLASLLYVRFLSAGKNNIIPPCGFHVLTGKWCPGCGLTRGTRALMHGHVMQALGFNLFTPVVLGLFIYVWLSWASPRVGGPTLPLLRAAPPVTWKILGAAVLIFTIARNLPIAPLNALAP